MSDGSYQLEVEKANMAGTGLKDYGLFFTYGPGHSIGQRLVGAFAAMTARPVTPSIMVMSPARMVAAMVVFNALIIVFPILSLYLVEMMQ